MKSEKMDTESVLRTLADLRKRLPFAGESAPRPAEDGRTRALDGIPLLTVEDFEYAAIHDAIESLIADVSAVAARKHAEVLETALNVYYTAEELSRDPEHADLIEQVEKMRAAYEKDFGREIPEKGKK